MKITKLPYDVQTAYEAEDKEYSQHIAELVNKANIEIAENLFFKWNERRECRSKYIELSKKQIEK